MVVVSVDEIVLTILYRLRSAANYDEVVEVLGVFKDDVIKLLREKIISNIFIFRDHRILKPKSKFILKNIIFFNSKLNGRKLGFIPL